MNIELEVACEAAFRAYQHLILEGAAREMARMVLPVNCYTQWYFQIDLHNLFHFLRLRLDGHAQFEAREYAKVMVDMVKTVTPMAHEAFVDHVLNAKRLSASELAELESVKKLNLS